MLYFIRDFPRFSLPVVSSFHLLTFFWENCIGFLSGYVAGLLSISHYSIEIHTYSGNPTWLHSSTITNSSLSESLSSRERNLLSPPAAALVTTSVCSLFSLVLPLSSDVRSRIEEEEEENPANAILYIHPAQWTTTPWTSWRPRFLLIATRESSGYNNLFRLTLVWQCFAFSITHANNISHVASQPLGRSEEEEENVKQTWFVCWSSRFHYLSSGTTTPLYINVMSLFQLFDSLQLKKRNLERVSSPSRHVCWQKDSSQSGTDFYMKIRLSMVLFPASCFFLGQADRVYFIMQQDDRNIFFLLSPCPPPPPRLLNIIMVDDVHVAWGWYFLFITLLHALMHLSHCAAEDDTRQLAEWVMEGRMRVMGHSFYVNIYLLSGHNLISMWWYWAIFLGKKIIVVSSFILDMNIRRKKHTERKIMISFSPHLRTLYVKVLEGKKLRFVKAV